MTNTSINTTIAPLQFRMQSGGTSTPRPSEPDLDDGSSAGNQLNQEQHGCDDQQDVNDAAGHIECESEQPEEHQQDNQRPQHDLFPPSADLRPPLDVCGAMSV